MASASIAEFDWSGVSENATSRPRTRSYGCFSSLLTLCVVLSSHPAFAWGDEGHRIIALVAEQFLDPAVRGKIAAMLAADPDTLTAHDTASEATWADRHRDSDRNGTRQHYAQTRDWHFVNIELDNPNLGIACFGHPPLPPAQLASNGPAQACIVDKIDKFVAEFADPASIRKNGWSR